MPDTTTLPDLTRYAGAIADLLSARLPTTPFQPESEDPHRLQIERGLVLPAALLRPDADLRPYIDRLITLGEQNICGFVAVVDRLGHQRAAYRALLVYSWLRAYGAVFERLPQSQFGRWEEGARPWCDLLEEVIGSNPWPDAMPPAARGAAWTEIAWTALALYAAGKIFIRDAWTDLAADAFGRIVRQQQPDGPFIETSPSDNPDTHAYNELMILHAAASYAVAAEDRTVAAAVARNTLWLQAHVQPDHATTQPWGVFAFAWNAPTRPLADALLHAAQLGSDTGVSFMLLADALYCLRLFGV